MWMEKLSRLKFGTPLAKKGAGLCVHHSGFYDLGVSYILFGALGAFWVLEKLGKLVSYVFGFIVLNENRMLIKKQLYRLVE